jgi:hypothetical protein
MYSFFLAGGLLGLHLPNQIRDDNYGHAGALFIVHLLLREAILLI